MCPQCLQKPTRGLSKIDEKSILWPQGVPGLSWEVSGYPPGSKRVLKIIFCTTWGISHKTKKSIVDCRSLVLNLQAVLDSMWCCYEKKKRSCSYGKDTIQCLAKCRVFVKTTCQCLVICRVCRSLVLNLPSAAAERSSLDKHTCSHLRLGRGLELETG